MSGGDKKISLFLCKCGSNIDETVNIEELKSWAEKIKDIDFVGVHDFLCAPLGKQYIQENVSKNPNQAVVIAACSPKTHEKTFREVLSPMDVNLAQVHIANIREQASWVTKDSLEAQEKARALIRAAIKRTLHHKDLEARFMECSTDVVVIGGGISGVEAAQMMASDTRKVTIIEKDISLGGWLIKTEEIAPNMECSPCLLTPRLSAVRDNKNINIITNAEVTDVLGFFGNFTIKAKKKARFVTEDCIGCEACFEVCPVSVKSDFHLGLGNRKAIYTAFAGSVPAAAVIDKDNCKHFKDFSCDACVQSCAFNAINFEDKDEEIEIKAGAVVLAIGFGHIDEKSLKNLTACEIENVLTMPHFERLISSNGPFLGDIRLSDEEQPKAAAVIHCAGSLNDNGIPYCSGICCLNALKAGELLRKKIPDIKVYNIHDRLVFNGNSQEAFYRHQIKEGTVFLNTNNLSSVEISKKGNLISVKADNIEPVDVDMVILSTGIIPSCDADNLKDILDIENDSAGFFKSDHSILHATGSSLDGIYVIGCCASPCDAQTSVTRAHAAAGDILAKLVPGKKIELEIMTSFINESLCAGCKLCITVCPYKAVNYDNERKISIINEAVCRGCGTCAAACPSNAAFAKHFTNEQIFAEIEGVIHE